MEISNKTLSWFVVAAIIVSIAGTSISLFKLEKTSGATGFVSYSNDTGNATVNIGTLTTLRYAASRAVLDFGTGQIDTSGGYNNCTLTVNNTDGTVTQTTGCLTFPNTGVYPLVLENAGNTDLNITLNFSKNSTNFIGGTAPYFKFQMVQNESASCTATLQNTSWTEVIESPTTASLLNVCQNLSWIDTNDSLRINLQIIIPADASGNKNVSILAQGTSFV